MIDRALETIRGAEGTENAVKTLTRAKDSKTFADKVEALNLVSKKMGRNVQDIRDEAFSDEKFDDRRFEEMMKLLRG